MQKKNSKPCGNFFFPLFWCSSPSTCGLTCIIWALLNPSSPTPKSSKPSHSCFYFDSQFNPVSYFYNLLGTFALFYLNGKGMGRGSRNICWVGGTPFPVTVLLHVPGITDFPVKQATKQAKTRAHENVGAGCHSAQETFNLTKGFCPVPRGQREQRAKGANMQTKPNQFLIN